MTAGRSTIGLAEAGRRTGLATSVATMAAVCDELGVEGADGRVDLEVFAGGACAVDLAAAFTTVTTGQF